MSSSDVSFIRWLEQNNMADYTSKLSDLGITSISHLLSLSHPQIIEVGRQLGCGHMRQVIFAESVVNHNKYANKHTINESILPSDSIKLAYKLLNLLKKLAIMGPRDNWDNVTEEIYALIDETKNLRALIALIEESLKIENDNYVAWDLNGLINARRGFLADARVAFQRALVQNPNYLNARFNHARLLHYELREYATAKAEYSCIIRIKPNFSRAYNSFAKLMEKMGDIELAEKYFFRAIQLRPQSISYRHCLANILSSQQRHHEVQQIYQEAVEQHPKSATLRFHHALALVKCKYLNESEMEFKNAIKLKAGNAQIYHEYAKFCERHREPRDYKKATELYFMACQTDPINFLCAAVDAANLMRRLDTTQSRASSAKLFEKLVVEAPHLNGAFLGFGKLLVREQKYLRATKILKEGLSHHPNDELLKEYFVKLSEKTAQPRPSVLYQSPTKEATFQYHASSYSMNDSIVKNQTTHSPHPKSSYSHDITRISPQQKLNSNLESSTDQFVKGVSFGSNSNSNSNSNLKQTTPSYSINMSEMSEDINTPPLPNMQLHAQRGRISNLLNKHKDLKEENESGSPLTTLNKHRKSIKNKIVINEQQIYQRTNSNSMTSKSKKYSSAPRTSQQFNPKTIKKRQSLQLNQSILPQTQSSKNDSERKKMRRKTTSEAAKNNAKDEGCLIM